MTQHEEVQMKLEALKANLLEDTPQLPGILQQIRMYLGKNPEVVTLLSEEEIGEIVNASMFVAKTKLVEAAIKKPKTKKLADTDLSDLM